MNFFSSIVFLFLQGILSQGCTWFSLQWLAGVNKFINWCETMETDRRTLSSNCVHCQFNPSANPGGYEMLSLYSYNLEEGRWVEVLRRASQGPYQTLTLLWPAIAYFWVCSCSNSVRIPKEMCWWCMRALLLKIIVWRRWFSLQMFHFRQLFESNY